MTPVFAIDPGPAQSAWCLIKNDKISGAILPNEEMVGLCRGSMSLAGLVVIEMIASYGMPVGAEVFETCVWIGRFIQAAERPVTRVFRKDVKLHLCGSPKAKDGNIRQALIDRYGAPGTKKAPGATYGIKKDIWAALAVATYAADKGGVNG